MRTIIPGLSEAYEHERRLREVVYLDQPHFVCGIPLNQITPRIFARLLFIRTPFIGGGRVTATAIGQFLWACHRDYAKPGSGWFPHRRRNRFLRSIRRMDFGLLEEGIDAFLDETFYDMPQGGKTDETPYVCGIAWLEYRMAREPFRWDSERTLETPLRRLYQLLRCDDAVNGATLFNRESDDVKADFLREANEDALAFDELSGGRN